MGQRGVEREGGGEEKSAGRERRLERRSPIQGAANEATFSLRAACCIRLSTQMRHRFEEADSSKHCCPLLTRCLLCFLVRSSRGSTPPHLDPADHLGDAFSCSRPFRCNRRCDTRLLHFRRRAMSQHR